ncbi:hypothetical protein [Lysobacter gummosus]|uniref:hypothetical protein n=1 Tax=Lysobacter gummosus TaxID=262324 RepID=UPI003641C18A
MGSGAAAAVWFMPQPSPQTTTAPEGAVAWCCRKSPRAVPWTQYGESGCLSS